MSANPAVPVVHEGQPASVRLCAETTTPQDEFRNDLVVHWDTDGDGIEDQFAPGDDCIEAVYDTCETIRLQLWVTDGHGGRSRTREHKLPIACNMAPVIDAFSVYPEDIEFGRSVQITAKAHDPDATSQPGITEFWVDFFGDGNFESQSVALLDYALNYRYPEVGCYWPRIRVVDSAGAIAESQPVRLCVRGRAIPKGYYLSDSDAYSVLVSDVAGAPGALVGGGAGGYKALQLWLDPAPGIKLVSEFQPAEFNPTRVFDIAVTNGVAFVATDLGGIAAYNISGAGLSAPSAAAPVMLRCGGSISWTPNRRVQNLTVGRVNGTSVVVAADWDWARAQVLRLDHTAAIYTDPAFADRGCLDTGQRFINWYKTPLALGLDSEQTQLRGHALALTYDTLYVAMGRAGVRMFPMKSYMIGDGSGSYLVNGQIADGYFHDNVPAQGIEIDPATTMTEVLANWSVGLDGWVHADLTRYAAVGRSAAWYSAAGAPVALTAGTWSFEPVVGASAYSTSVSMDATVWTANGFDVSPPSLRFHQPTLMVASSVGLGSVRLYAIEPSSPSAPVLLAEGSPFGQAQANRTSVAFVGGWLLHTVHVTYNGGPKGIYAYPVTDLARTPMFIARAAGYPSPNDVESAGGMIAYVADGPDGVHVIDLRGVSTFAPGCQIDTWGTCMLTGRVPDAASAKQGGEILDLAFDRGARRLLAASGDAGVKILDFAASVVDSPTVGFLTGTAQAVDVASASSGNTYYHVAGGTYVSSIEAATLGEVDRIDGLSNAICQTARYEGTQGRYGYCSGGGVSVVELRDGRFYNANGSPGHTPPLGAFPISGISGMEQVSLAMTGFDVNPFRMFLASNAGSVWSGCPLLNLGDCPGEGDVLPNSSVLIHTGWYDDGVRRYLLNIGQQGMISVWLSSGPSFSLLDEYSLCGSQGGVLPTSMCWRKGEDAKGNEILLPRTPPILTDVDFVGRYAMISSRGGLVALDMARLPDLQVGAVYDGLAASTIAAYFDAGTGNYVVAAGLDGVVYKFLFADLQFPDAP